MNVNSRIRCIKLMERLKQNKKLSANISVFLVEKEKFEKFEKNSKKVLKR